MKPPSSVRNQHEAGSKHRVLFSACFILVFSCSFDPEDGGKAFLRKVGELSTDNTVFYPRRQDFQTRIIYKEFI
jgi:hypothetical protein